jgi:hypothetical protein
MEWSNNSFDISFSCETDSIKDLLDSLFNDNKYNVIITDNEGNSVGLKDKTIENHIKVTRRIPRKMKKDLKKIYGKFWKFYHPNTETVYKFK